MKTPPRGHRRSGPMPPSTRAAGPRKSQRSTGSDTGNGRRRGTIAAAMPEGAGPMAERVEMRRFFVTVAAVAAAMALTWGLADRALAVEEISEFATHVSTTQAGGHPDVDYAVTWTARNSTNRPCNCEDARVLDMHLPTRFIGDPHNAPACRLTEFALHQCPPESQVGVVEIQNAVREAMFNLVPHADEAGLTGFYVLGANTALFVILHARTGSDYGLDATTSPI